MCPWMAFSFPVNLFIHHFMTNSLLVTSFAYTSVVPKEPQDESQHKKCEKSYTYYVRVVALPGRKNHFLLLQRQTFFVDYILFIVFSLNCHY